MSLYAIGDVQGCYDALRRLLDCINYDPAADKLWFAGDVVNRGRQSLEVLNFISSLGEGAEWVLGNHELHLLKLADGLISAPHSTLDTVLNAANADSLLAWVARQPLLRIDYQRKLILVHAGLLPQWDIALAIQLAEQVSQQLRSTQRKYFLSQLLALGNKPALWDDSLQGIDRAAITINAMTTIRFCDRQGCMDFSAKSPPDECQPDLYPWYTLAHRRDPSYTVLFGHWAALGYRRMESYIALDSGCVWGGYLSAYRLDLGNEQIFQVPCDKVA
ncbi:MAG: symmetrical bis(5'-nucleosyl)-tetraphosphatase [Chromatiales bacterium]|nr:symmetrical bis(5'-nucleosyl)-tetraphosphatase [Chromatiales bacterium]